MSFDKWSDQELEAAASAIFWIRYGDQMKAIGVRDLAHLEEIFEESMTGTDYLQYVWNPGSPDSTPVYAVEFYTVGGFSIKSDLIRSIPSALRKSE